MATDIKNDATLSTNLVSCWVSDSSGLTTDLVTGTGNDLTNSGVSLTTGGPQGDTGDWDGTADWMYITDAAQTNLEGTGNFGIAAWMNLDTFSAALYVVASKFNGAENKRGYLFGPQESSGSLLRFQVETDAVTVTYGSGFSTGTWYHIGMTFDTTSNNVKFYVNGSQVGTTQTMSTNVTDYVTEFELGSLNNGGANRLDGKMNQICFWNKDVSATEFSDLYNSGSGIPYEDSGGGATDPAIFFGANF